jgi:hypothetical protein
MFLNNVLVIPVLAQTTITYTDVFENVGRMKTKTKTIALLPPKSVPSFSLRL